MSWTEGKRSLNEIIKRDKRNRIASELIGHAPCFHFYKKWNIFLEAYILFLLFDHRPWQLRTGRNLIYWYTRVYSLELSQMGKKPAICSVSTHNLACSNSSLTCMPGEKKVCLCALWGQGHNLLSWALSREAHNTWHTAGV